MAKIELKPTRVLIRPLTATSSSFSTETKKYERRSLAIVDSVSHYVSSLKGGEKVVYDDSNAIDFTLDGVNYSVIRPDDIVAYIKEDDG